MTEFKERKKKYEIIETKLDSLSFAYDFIENEIGFNEDNFIFRFFTKESSIDVYDHLEANGFTVVRLEKKRGWKKYYEAEISGDSKIFSDPQWIDAKKFEFVEKSHKLMECVKIITIMALSCFVLFFMFYCHKKSVQKKMVVDKEIFDFDKILEERETFPEVGEKEAFIFDIEKRYEKEITLITEDKNIFFKKAVIDADDDCIKIKEYDDADLWKITVEIPVNRLKGITKNLQKMEEK